MAAKKQSSSAPWKKPNPKKRSKKLTPRAKASAKSRAKRAGRKYPNLVDNMRAASEARKRKNNTDSSLFARQTEAPRKRG